MGEGHLCWENRTLNPENWNWPGALNPSSSVLVVYPRLNKEKSQTQVGFRSGLWITGTVKDKHYLHLFQIGKNKSIFSEWFGKRGCWIPKRPSKLNFSILNRDGYSEVSPRTVKSTSNGNLLVEVDSSINAQNIKHIHIIYCTPQKELLGAESYLWRYPKIRAA